MNKRKKTEKISQAKEPKANYKMSFVSFNSFEEMNEYDIRQMASQTPIDNLKHATELIKQIFASELESKISDFTIRFK